AGGSAVEAGEVGGGGEVAGGGDGALAGQAAGGDPVLARRSVRAGREVCRGGDPVRGGGGKIRAQSIPHAGAVRIGVCPDEAEQVRRGGEPVGPVAAAGLEG